MGARWLKDILISGSLAQLRDAVEANAARFGFRYFIYHGFFPGTRSGGNDVHFDNCPEGWNGFYRARGDEGARLLGIRNRDQVTPALWSQMSHVAPRFFDKAQAFGLVTGSTHPVHGPRGEWSAISFVKDHGGVRAEAEVRAALARCQLLASCVHDAVRRIREQRSVAAIALPQPHPDARDLNERECQVLTWVAAGKTTSEIASIMPISERTVSFHLSNARRKLGAANSRHAITRALSLGLIETGFEAPRAPGADPA
jgi:DNA-binding CsgD family transcriptional regulator